MKKIPTIFDRDWEGNYSVIDKWMIDPTILKGAVATEKVDGINVRITVRSDSIVRLEKRRNPTKEQKADGITEPWYVDADENDPQDKFIYDAVKTYTETRIASLCDGVYSGEAYGEKIQGNPLKITGHTIYLFSSTPQPLSGIQLDFKGIKDFLHTQQSKVYRNDNVFIPIEGIVWHKDGEPIAKIKLKDFK